MTISFGLDPHPIEKKPADNVFELTTTVLGMDCTEPSSRSNCRRNMSPDCKSWPLDGFWLVTVTKTPPVTPKPLKLGATLTAGRTLVSTACPYALLPLDNTQTRVSIPAHTLGTISESPHRPTETFLS